MSGLDFKKAPSCLPSKRMGDKSSKVRKSDVQCCNVKAIIGTMLEEQREHQFSKFGEAYFRDRKVVVSWMMDVCEYFSLHPTTIHGAIAYLDRLQPSDKHSRYEWKMFVVCCILISAKYNESESDVPDLETLEYLIQLPIPKETLLNYELWTLQKLGWKLNARTPLAFIACYVVCGVAHASDVCWDASHNKLFTWAELDSRIAEECYAMASFALLESRIKAFKASDVACAILYFVRRALGVVPLWSAELSDLTHTSPSSEGASAALQAFDQLLQSRTSPSSTSGSESGESSPIRSSRQSDLHMTTPVCAKGSRERDGCEVEDLTDLVSATTISVSENLNQGQGQGQVTPEEKESKGKYALGLLPSPVSVIAMDSLEQALVV